MLVCSNRGPFTFEGSVDAPIAKRGGGGLINSIAPVIEGAGGTWIAAPLSDTDRRLARKYPRGYGQDGFTLRFLDVPKDLHHLHYDVMSNEVLWFLFHYLFDVPHEPRFDGLFESAWDGYRRVNELYAEAVAQEPGRAVLFEDYQLMLAAGFLRERTRARRPLIYFHHTPWCEPDYFSMLPERVGKALLEGMLAHDVVGFHSRRWVNAFLRCCERFVPRARVSTDEVRFNRRSTKILVAPVPIDAARLREDADDPSVRSWLASHDEMRSGRKLLLRVDRIDLSKNPLRGFLAFELLLERRPALAKEVLFMAMLYPSRLSVERYQSYLTECLGVVRRVNERYENKLGTEVGPIHLVYEDDFHRSLAAMRLYDVLLVNPVFDGLNLVSKEGATVNERAGSIILSTNAGSFDQLSSAVIPVDPFDVPATADAMERGLEMPQAERTVRDKKLKKLASSSTPADWLQLQLDAAG